MFVCLPCVTQILAGVKGAGVEVMVGVWWPNPFHSKGFNKLISPLPATFPQGNVEEYKIPLIIEILYLNI